MPVRDSNDPALYPFAEVAQAAIRGAKALCRAFGVAADSSFSLAGRTIVAPVPLHQRNWNLLSLKFPFAQDGHLSDIVGLTTFCQDML